MDNVSTPVEKAKWVLETKNINEPPASRLKYIAESEGIRYGFEKLPDDKDLSGMLLFYGTKRGILINTFINNPGRINFTFAHELGHYFLNHTPPFYSDKQQGFFCSADDIQNDTRPMETDANKFAIELLMPEHMFRLQMAGAELDFALIGGLASYFQVSKHTSGFRVLDFIRHPHIIILSQGYTITFKKNSLSARRFCLKYNNSIPLYTRAYEAITKNRWCSEFTLTEANKWLQNCSANQELYECTRGSGEYAMTILRMV